MFEIIRIPAFKDNYIWLLRKGASAVVVDPGEAHGVLEVLARECLTLSSMLITHHHHDHQDGVADLLLRYPSAEVFGPAVESITGLTRPLRGGETIAPAGLDVELQVLAVPGHTLGHLAYYCPDALFCGDILFGAGCGRLFEGTPAQMFDSLTRLAALPNHTSVYCAHEYTELNLRFALSIEPGNRRLQQRADEVAMARAKGLATVPSTLALEKATNPFLRSSEPEVLASALASGAQSNDPLAVFTALRERRNGF